MKAILVGCLSVADGKVLVDSDLMAAAHALCGGEEGIACILGTGANSCLFDGEKIVANISPLGYILGYEKQLVEAARQCGYTVGKIIKSPMEGLVANVLK